MFQCGYRQISIPRETAVGSHGSMIGNHFQHARLGAINYTGKMAEVRFRMPSTCCLAQLRELLSICMVMLRALVGSGEPRIRIDSGVSDLLENSGVGWTDFRLILLLPSVGRYSDIISHSFYLKLLSCLMITELIRTEDSEIGFSLNLKERNRFEFTATFLLSY